MKGLKTLLITLIFLLNIVQASEIKVDKNNLNCVSGSQANPYSAVYCTIQGAINDSSSGDLINVSFGTYNEDLKVLKNSIEIETKESATIKGISNVKTADWPVANIEILSDDVKIHGFTIESPDYVPLRYTSGIIIGGKDIEIYNNSFIINSAGSKDEVSKAIQTYPKSELPGVDISGLDIHDNSFMHKNPSGDWGYEGIYINPDEGNGKINIDNNRFGGKIFRAITSERSKVDIKNNDIITELVPSDLSSPGAYQGINIQSFDSGIQTNIEIEGNIIKGSLPTKGFYQGIRLGQSGQTFSNIKVKNCILNYNEIGVLVKVANGLSVNYNRIFDNSLYGVDNEDLNNINATYNWWGNCNGPKHSTNPLGLGDKVSDNVDFKPWLGVCIGGNKATSCAFETDNITLSANVTGSLDSVWFSYTIDGYNHNKTASNKEGTIYSVVIPSTELIWGKNVTWNTYANDSLNVYNNSWVSFYVRKRTQLMVEPQNPDGLKGWYITEPLYTLVKDSKAGNVYYQWDSTQPNLYTMPFGLEKIPNYPPKESAGTLDVNWWANFSDCIEPRQTKLFYVDLTNPVIKDLEPANSSTVYNDHRPVISAYLDEVFQSNSGINESNVVLRLDGGIVSAIFTRVGGLDAIINYTPTNDLAIGNHTVMVSVTDNSGRSSESSWFFRILETPAISTNIIAPLDGIYGDRNIKFNISMGGVVEVLEYINYNNRVPDWKVLCKDCTGYGNSRQRTNIMMEGNNSLSFRVKDTLGNIKIINRTVFIDSKAPTIIGISPRAKSIINGSDFIVRYSEDNLKKVSLIWNGTKNLDCPSGINQECKTTVDLSSHDGEKIEYYFNLSDPLRTVSSKKIMVMVDTSPPKINKIEIVNVSKRIRNIIVNITEKNLARVEYIDYSGLTPKYNVLCTQLRDGLCERQQSFRSGMHNITIKATDKVGYVETEDTQFVV